MFELLHAIDIPGEELIRSESGPAEKAGALTKQQLELIYANRWFHLLVPKTLGGREMPLPEFARFVERLAYADGSFAWNVNLGAGANMFAGFMAQEEAARIFSDPAACVAGSGAKSGTAREADDGFIIDGSWKYASGSAHATYFSLNAVVQGSGKESFRSFLVPASQVKVSDSWKVFGMKATSSCDFRVDSVWVPAACGFDLQHPSPVLSSALYRFPFLLLAEINMLVMVTGMAMRFWVLTREVLEEKGTLEGRALVALEESKTDFSGRRNAVFEALDRLWLMVENGEETETDEEEAYRKAVAACAAASRRLVDQLYPYAGMKVVFEETELSRVFRDFKVASQHALLSPAGPV